MENIKHVEIQQKADEISIKILNLLESSVKETYHDEFKNKLEIHLQVEFENIMNLVSDNLREKGCEFRPTPHFDGVEMTAFSFLKLEKPKNEFGIWKRR